MDAVDDVIALDTMHLPYLTAKRASHGGRLVQKACSLVQYQSA